MKTNLILLVAMLLLLTACQRNPQQEPDQEDTVTWESAGYVMETPADWADRFLINPEGDVREETGLLFEICHKETYQAGEVQGWVLSIVRWDETQYQTEKDAGELEVLATDDTGYYYCKCLPMDVQFTSEETLIEMNEFLGSQELADVLADFVSRNGLTAWTA